MQGALTARAECQTDDVVIARLEGQARMAGDCRQDAHSSQPKRPDMECPSVGISPGLRPESLAEGRHAQRGVAGYRNPGD
jgi:hypothetical protein